MAGYVRIAILGILIGCGLLAFQYVFGAAAGRFAFGAFMAAALLPGLIRPTAG